MRNLSESVVLVTGASRGIGAASCEVFLRRGATVFGCSRSGEAPDGVVAVEADVSSPEDVRRLLAGVRDEAGRLDVLVNNAGVLGPRARIDEVTFAQWRNVMDVNLDGVFHVSRASLPLLSDGGIIINISSSVGRRGRGEWGPYAVSKHGVEGLTDVLGDELADRDIAVVSLNPGGTATDMRAEAYPDEDPDTLPSATEVAGTVVDVAERHTVHETKAKLNSRDLLNE